MAGIASVLDMGRWALFGSQNAIEVTGNNISNLNTEGYSRQSVQLQEGPYIDYNPGMLGTGVRSTAIVRNFSEFIERQYNDKASLVERYSTLNTSLRSIENLFNESGGEGISSAITQFFDTWQKLSQSPSDYPSREALLSDARNLMNSLKQAGDDLGRLQVQADDFIKQEVNQTNEILQKIAGINKQINSHEVEGQNNANGLRDDRARLVRDLAEKLDINYIDNGSGNVTITTKAGQTLVDGDQAFSIIYRGAQTFSNLTTASTYDGQIHYNGSDDFEYTVEMLGTGTVSGAGGAQFKVSMDGGVSWLRNEDGTIRTFSAHTSNAKVQVEKLSVWFDASAQNLSAGDRFLIVPKGGIYWQKATGGEQNITPEIAADGSENARRITGGTLGGYFQFRDYHVGRYKHKLDTLAAGMAWEINRLHSQGAGLTNFGQATSTYAVQNDTFALGSGSSGLAFNTRLQSGSAMMYFYNSTTGAYVSGGALSGFTSAGGPDASFNPAVHSLESVRDAVNSSFGTYVTATIVNHRLQLTANSGYSFAFGTDTAGLTAGLGLNTFFTGSTSHDLGLNEQVGANADFINAGHVNGGAEWNVGDNTVAVEIAGLQRKAVRLTTFYEGTTSQSLEEYYNSLVANVGSDTGMSKFNFDYHTSLAKDLDARQNEVSGVNLDEEMSNLIKFQHSYQAAAKLISTADQMLQALLGMKN